MQDQIKFLIDYNLLSGKVYYHNQRFVCLWKCLGKIFFYSSNISFFFQLIPWKHFGRKNLGYLFAIAHGGQSVLLHFDLTDIHLLDSALCQHLLQALNGFTTRTTTMSLSALSCLLTVPSWRWNGKQNLSWHQTSTNMYHGNWPWKSTLRMPLSVI